MARVGRCLQGMLRWGRSARREVSNARVGRPVEDEPPDVRPNAYRCKTFLGRSGVKSPPMCGLRPRIGHMIVAAWPMRRLPHGHRTPGLAGEDGKHTSEDPISACPCLLRREGGKGIP